MATVDKKKLKRKLEKATGLKDKGNAAFARGDTEEAIKSFTEAMTLDADNHVYYSNRSAVYAKLTKWEESERDGRKCIQLKPDFVKGYTRAGAALVGQGRYEDAIVVYKDGLKVDAADKTLKDGIFAAEESLNRKTRNEEARKSQQAEEDLAKKQRAETLAKAAGTKDNTTADGSEKKSEEKSDKPKEYVIGIDLGTTYSCVGVWRGNGVEIISNSHGARTTPSYVAFLPNGDRMVGQPAKTAQANNARNTLYDIKRIIGQRFTDYGVEKDIRHFPFTCVPGGEDGSKPLIEVELDAGKKRFEPEQISAMVLADLKKTAEDHLKQPVTKAVVTVPAYFNDAQRKATKAAGAIAGLEVLRIINEPTAAALAYGLDVQGLTNEAKKKSNILIFDLGGGTFDVSILTIEGGIFEVKATGGDTHLGGEDFDQNVVNFLVNEARTMGCADPTKDLRAMKRLRTEAEKAKRQLSNVTVTDVAVSALMPSFDFNYKLTRAKFNDLNRDYFLRCVDTVKHVMKDAKMKIEEINEIVMVGGSTRIPKIQEMLQTYFKGKELCKSVNPDEAVAYGAAVQAAILNGERNNATRDILLMDVTPLSLGIETTGRVMSVIIPRNTPIPATKTQTYTTEENFQTAVDVCVYEGERLKTDGNNMLGQFTITGIERAKRGEPQVDVTFSLDSDGILTVTAKDQKTGAKADIQIKNRSQLSTEQLNKMIAEAEKLRKDDELKLKMVEARNELERVILEVGDIGATIEDKKLAGILSQAAEKAQEWLEANPNALPAELARQRRTLELRIQSRR
jgi:L1 cell adhesion molecule like protein